MRDHGIRGPDERAVDARVAFDTRTEERPAGAPVEAVVLDPPSLPVFWQELWLAPRNAAIAVMNGYRRTISPLYGQVCKYYPSCSRYAVEALQRQGLLVGVALTAWRLLRCNPFSSGGVDDAPVRQRRRYLITARGYVRPVNRKA